MPLSNSRGDGEPRVTTGVILIAPHQFGESNMGQSNIYRSTIQSPAAFQTQAEKIEDLLRSRYGQWVPAYEVATGMLQHGARINGIRKNLKRAGDRERIENKKEWINGQCHSWYRIVLTSDVLGITPVNPKPLKSWDEIVREREEKMREPAPSFELTPP